MRRCRSWMFPVRVAWAVGVAVLVAGAAGAELGRTAFRLFAEEDGLSETSVECLAQDRDGFLWVGTQDGLFRFDGRSFFRFGREEGLPSSRINVVFEDSRGTLWVGTRGGLARRDGDRFETLADEKGMPAAPVSDRGLAEDASGRILVATQKGLFGGDAAGFRSLLHAASDGATLVTGLHVAPDGTIYFARKNALFRWHAGGEEPFGASHFLGTSEQIDQVLTDASGALWVRSLSDLWSLAPGAQRFVRANEGLPAAIASGRLALDDRGELMLPTGRGIALRRNGEWRLFGPALGLPAPTATAALFDREGTLWVGLAGAGLAERLGGGTFTSFAAADGLSHDVVWGIAPRFDTGDLWVATEDGLSRLVFGPGGAVVAAAAIAETRGTFYAVTAARDGSVWAGSWPGGVTRFGPEPGRVRRYAASGLAPADFKVTSVHLRGDDVWVGASTGVFRLAASGLFEPAATPGGESPDGVYAFAETPDGNLWCAGRFGLQRLTGAAPRRYRKADGLRADFLASLVALPDGELWAGYREALGIARFQLDGDRLVVRPLGSRDGLASDKVLFLGRDPKPRVWVGTPRGIDLVTFDGRLATHFGRADGLPTEDMDQNAFAADDSRAVWVGTSRGLARFDLGAPEVTRAPPPVRLTEAWSGARRLALGASARLASNERTLLVRWAGLTFIDPRRVRFRYRLEGLEESETETSTPEARFSALPTGSYRFRVVAISAAGIESRQPAELLLVIAPRWYERTAARIGFVALAALLVFGFVRLRTRALEADRRHLEEAVAARSAELAAALAEVKDISYRDPLTGLRNRRFFAEALELELARLCRAHGPGAPAGNRDLLCLIVDLDHFKEVNDRYGHAAGDRVLVEAARRLRGACRESDLIVRWGGEEFLILANQADRVQAETIVRRLLASFGRQPFDLGTGTSIVRTCSIGWAPIPWNVGGKPGPAWERVVALADRALYLAKEEGRNRAVGVMPLERGAPEPDPWTQPLRGADGRSLRLVDTAGGA